MYIIYNCINGDIDLAFYSELLSSFVICNKGNGVGVTCGGGTAYPSGAPEFIPQFLVGFVLLNL